MIARENWKYTKQLFEHHKWKGKVVNIFSGTYGSVAPTQKIFNHLTSLAWAASSSAMTSLSVFTGSSTLVLSWGTTVSVSGILSGIGHSVTTKYNAQGWWLVAALSKASRFTPRIPHDCGTGGGPGAARAPPLLLTLASLAVWNRNDAGTAQVRTDSGLALNCNIQFLLFRVKCG